MTIVSILVLKY